ncbi:MAG: response regulator, partial [Methylocapsa sp.]|nr:response regulator [Methylocapsa sp.]
MPAAGGTGIEAGRWFTPISSWQQDEESAAMPEPVLYFLSAPGEMAERTRFFDWRSTALGPPAAWPQPLKTAVGICLASRHPIVIWWGKDTCIQFYNDAYIPFLGTAKHPGCLGRSGRECWSEIWPTIGPMIDGVFASGQATWSEDLLLVLRRNLPREECYFTFSYGAIRGEDGAIGGIFCACNETTARVVGERRLQARRDLGRLETEARTTAGACEIAIRTLAGNRHDVPFALLYLLDAGGSHALLAAATGLGFGSVPAPSQIGLETNTAASASWPLRQVFEANSAQFVRDLSSRFGRLPGGVWPEPAETAIVVPLAAPGQPRPAGFLVAGLSPRRPIDANYRAHLDLTGRHIGALIANARAYEAERQRAEALAEIDRAKTVFFSNVSHEFRTPLTLMMGPLEDVLGQSSGLRKEDRERLEMAHRNSLRLLKLVNSLLDFSRIEAGRIQASFEPADLAALTAELASVFRSAIEHAGLKFVIDCPPVKEPVYVDREMWEKIVLNLISNAFKFTLEGEIEILLRQVDSSVQLTVRDTGTGIPAREIPHLFERFHRIRNARGRSFEGSGIGLALVRELVKLHGGTVRVESEVNRGSRFIVAIPLGKAHLPPGRIEAARTQASTGLRAEAYMEEALRWLPNEPHDPPGMAGAPDQGLEPGSIQPAAQKRQLILIADDNADMRGYLGRILSGYEVSAAADGLSALRRARECKPDLVLADVMMPERDGIGLLRELRADPQLKLVPVILLSARAGEEARIEGMHAGADDYLIKPFSARELRARVESHLKIARIRKEAAEALRYRTEQFATLLNQAPLGVYLVDADLRIREANPIARLRFGDIPGGVINRDLNEIAHMLLEKEFADEIVRIFRRALETGEPCITPARAVLRAGRATAEYYEWRLDRIVLPDGRFGVVCYFRDISERVQAEATRQLLMKELNHRIKNTLANVQAIAYQTQRTAKNPADFVARFSGRIQSLARVHALLTDTSWRGADLRGIILDQILEGPADESRIITDGPAVTLRSQTALHFALVIHELGTNAVKYGALSVPGGRIEIDWSVDNDRLQMRWAERGGPAVTAAPERGFGTTLIEQSAKSENGFARMFRGPDGVTWEISMALPQEEDEHAFLRNLESRPPMRMEQQEKGCSAIPHASLRGLRFLVVDDEPLIALDAACSLQSAGAEADAANTETQALQIIAEADFDGVLLDANL